MVLGAPEQEPAGGFWNLEACTSPTHIQDILTVGAPRAWSREDLGPGQEGQGSHKEGEAWQEEGAQGRGWGQLLPDGVPATLEPP